MILMKGFEVEVYVQDSNEPHVASGIYSLSDNKWLKEPSQYRLDINYSMVKEKAAKLMEEIDNVYDIYAILIPSTVWCNKEDDFVKISRI